MTPGESLVLNVVILLYAAAVFWTASFLSGLLRKGLMPKPHMWLSRRRRNEQTDICVGFVSCGAMRPEEAVREWQRRVGVESAHLALAEVFDRAWDAYYLRELGFIPTPEMREWARSVQSQATGNLDA